MITRFSLMLLATVLLCLGNAACAESQYKVPPTASSIEIAKPPKELGQLIKTLDPRIGWVLSGGRWCQGEVSGYYRGVVYEGGFEEVSHWLFIQLVQVDEEKHVLKILQTIDIPELSGLDTYLSDLAIENSDRLTCAELSLIGRASRRGAQGMVKHRFRVRVAGDGRYRVEGR